MIHAPSLAIGAIIASITITVVMFGLNSITDEIGLSMEPTPKIQGALNLQKLRWIRLYQMALQY